MESYHVLRLVDMPINVVSVLQVFSKVESRLFRFHLERTRRPVPEPRNHHLNKYGASASCDNQYQILNMKRLRNLDITILLLGQVNY
jgi:hypothetical protein